MHRGVRTVITAAMVFAVAMGALQNGGWWWAWLAGAVLMGMRRGVGFPLSGGGRVSAANRFITADNRRIGRDLRRQARQKRRANREKLRNSKRSRDRPL
jgi:hypothetical protein